MNPGENQIDGYEDGEKPLVFHHKNGEYRQYMSENLRDLATGKALPKRGFFRVLVSTRGNRIMLFVMCLTFVLFIFLNIFGKNSNQDVINGIEAELTAFSFDDQIYVSLSLKDYEKNRTSSKKESDKADKKIAGKKTENIFPLSTAPKNISVKLELINTDEETAYVHEDTVIFDGSNNIYRQTFTDYDMEKVKCTLENQEKKVILNTKIQKH